MTGDTSCIRPSARVAANVATTTGARKTLRSFDQAISDDRNYDQNRSPCELADLSSHNPAITDWPAYVFLGVVARYITDTLGKRMT